MREVLRSCGQLISPVFVLSDADRTSDYGAMVERVAETVYARGDDDRTIQELGSLGADGVVTFDDAQVELADRVARAHGWRGRAMPGAFDKVVQRRRLNECGASRVHVHEIVGLEEFERARKTSPHGVVKPRRSTMSNGVRVVSPSETTADLWTELRHLGGSFLYEEWMDHADAVRGLGPYVSVETASLGSQRLHFGVSDKLPLVRGCVETGDLAPSTLPDREIAEVLDVTTRALDALSISDLVTHTEVRLTSTGPQVIEVNGRLGGGVQEIHRALGLDPCKMALRLALGHPVGKTDLDASDRLKSCLCLIVPMPNRGDVRTREIVVALRRAGLLDSVRREAGPDASTWVLGGFAVRDGREAAVDALRSVAEWISDSPFGGDAPRAWVEEVRGAPARNESRD